VLPRARRLLLTMSVKLFNGATLFIANKKPKKAIGGFLK
jgi:hypothetical protein